MNTETLFSEALGIIDPWYIEKVSFDQEQKRLNVRVNFKKGSVFEYSDSKTGEVKYSKAYDTVEKTWRHLNFFEHECYLTVRTPRIRPEGCGTKMVMPPWSGVVSGFTLLFEKLILEMCTNMPVHKVGQILGISDRKLWHVLDCYVSKGESQADHREVEAIGMDETSLKRGHEYITLFVDLKDRKTIYIAPGKDHRTVEEFAIDFTDKNGEPKAVKDVSCDMSPAFIKGVKTYLPNARITFDKFHILKLINEAVDAVRRSEAKEESCLKGARYVFLKNKTNLTAKQQEKREALSQKNLKSFRALRIREAFQEIYKAQNIEEFEGQLKAWYFWATHCRLEPIKSVAKTLKNHWDGIVQWKMSNINNGILEGLNSVVQAAKRKARGYGYKHFRTMAFLLTGKFDFKAINNCLPTCFA